MFGKRTEIQRENDLRDIARWYLKGWTQQQIADTINGDPERGYTISRVQVTHDLAKLRGLKERA